MKDPIPCESCTTPERRVLIRFVRVHGENGLSWMPVNAEPDPAGNVAVNGATARVLADDQQPAPYEVLYMPHFATCVAPQAHRKPPRRNKGRTAVQPTKTGKRRSAPNPGLF